MHRSANAMMECCPATVFVEAVKPSTDAPGNDTAAALYGFELAALGPRIVQGSIAFDTDAGWYTVSVPAVPLQGKVRHFTSISATYERRDFISSRMYAKFPQPVRIVNWWLDTARAEADGSFGWHDKGQVRCSPSFIHDKPTPINRYAAKMDPKDADDLQTPPQAGSMILDATRSLPLYNRNCKEPFADATAQDAVTPLFPPDLRNANAPLGSTGVQVAINADGSLADAWVWQPSGIEKYDAAALDAAKRSKYKGARAYCMPVPSRYMFFVTFSPR